MMRQPDPGKEDPRRIADDTAFRPVNMAARRARRCIGGCAILCVLLCGAVTVCVKLRQPRLVEVIVRQPGESAISGTALGLSVDTPHIADRVEVYQRPGSGVKEYHVYLGKNLDRVIIGADPSTAGQ